MTQLSASRIFLNKTIKDIIKEILEERQKFEDSVFKHQFRANPLNRKMFKGSLDNIIEREKKERETRTKKLQEDSLLELYFGKNYEKQR